tara:strand:- start:9943 stop:11538 length:1596 start_codon:yes stop_codon:yes gene_type:complete
MAKKNSFGFSFTGSSASFANVNDYNANKIKPITTEFSKGSIPDSIYTSNREASWSRWRRGYELAVGLTESNDYIYPFKYEVPESTTSGNPTPTISGAFVGFPTVNRDLGMQWAVWRYAGSFRTDSAIDPDSGSFLSVKTVTEDDNYWFVTLEGNWSLINPLPSPFFIPVSGQPDGLEPATTEIFEDRIVELSGELINKETINPETQTRYGYIQAVLIDSNPYTGVLKFRKAGSVEITPDATYVTPATQGFRVGRFLNTGSRYCCTCQDFTHRDYAFISNLSESDKKRFPRSNIASIKPGRHESVTLTGAINNSAMTSIDLDRFLDVVSPENFQVGYTVQSSGETVTNNPHRDNPGIFREFGSTYTRSTTNISVSGSNAEGIPKYNDYDSLQLTVDFSVLKQDILLTLTDNWTPLLDELRYCKHIYALKFKDRLFPPEPSDFPVGMGSMVEWEEKLVAKTQSDRERAQQNYETIRALGTMDVPPYNAQSPVLYPMLQKLFNITIDRISLRNFTMFDKNNQPYIPASGEKPGI